MSCLGGDIDLAAGSRREGYRFRIGMESCDPAAENWTRRERKIPQLSRPAQRQAACVSAMELQRVNVIESYENGRAYRIFLEIVRSYHLYHE